MIFQQPPVDFKKEIDVVGCFVLWSDRFLLLHRHEHKTNGGKWGLPAGKRDANEDLSHAMVRELQEETGIVIRKSSLTPRGSVFVRHAGRDFVYHMFSIELSGEPPISLSPTEHQAYRWVTPEESFVLPLVHDQAECTKMMFGIQ